jgi:hypothetical protein
MWRKRSIRIWLIVVVLFLGLCTPRWIFPTVEARATTYKVDRIDTDNDLMPSSAMEKLLNQRSHEGWDLITTATSQRGGNTVTIALIFKR